MCITTTLSTPPGLTRIIQNLNRSSQLTRIPSTLSRSGLTSRSTRSTPQILSPRSEYLPTSRRRSVDGRTRRICRRVPARSPSKAHKNNRNARYSRKSGKRRVEHPESPPRGGRSEESRAPPFPSESLPNGVSCEPRDEFDSTESTILLSARGRYGSGDTWRMTR